MADVKFEGKMTRICLTQVMHVPGTDGKISSLNKLDQKGFKIRIIRGHIHILKVNEVYAQASLGRDLHKVKMKIIRTQESVMATVKRDTDAADLSTWHRRLCHLGDMMLKKLATSGIIKGIEVTNMQLTGICEDCIVAKMDEKPFKNQTECDTRTF